MNSFPNTTHTYNLSTEDYFELLMGNSRNHMIHGLNCCFATIMNIQINFGGSSDLTKAMITPLHFSKKNIVEYNRLFNENLMSLGYFNLTELLLDSGYESVDTPQMLDIAWCQTESDLATLRDDQPFDMDGMNNGYIYDGDRWLERDVYRWHPIESEEKVAKITSNGIYRMVIE